MKEKRKIALAMSILVILTVFGGCGRSYHPDAVEQRAVEEAYQNEVRQQEIEEAYREGYLNGLEEGYSEGYREGYNDGYGDAMIDYDLEDSSYSSDPPKIEKNP